MQRNPGTAALLFSPAYSKEYCGLFSEEEDHIDEMDEDHRAVEGNEEG